MARGRGDQVDTNFTRGAPYKIWDFWQLSTLIANISGTDWRIENRKSTWSTTFHPLLEEKIGELRSTNLDREYLRNGSTYRKLEKYLINYISSPIGWNKIRKLWSTNQKVIDAHVDPLKWTFWNTKFRPLGVLDPEIFTHFRHSPRLANGHHKQGRGSPKKF